MYVKFVFSLNETYLFGCLKELHHLIRVDMKIYLQLKEEIKLIEAIIENDT